MIRFSYVGKSLKETSLDETVQVLNMLKGEMSLIGPRASEWGALESYQQNEVDKMKVRPGITGYTQAYFRNSITVREQRLKDAWYANHISFRLDIQIFFLTRKTIVEHDNVYTN